MQFSETSHRIKLYLLHQRVTKPSPLLALLLVFCLYHIMSLVPRGVLLHSIMDSFFHCAVYSLYSVLLYSQL